MTHKNFSKAHSRLVLPGQYWRNGAGDGARVMAVAEGYAMMRFNRQPPFLLLVTDLDEWTVIGGADIRRGD